MTTEIFIVTHAKDFPWLKYCLRSIGRFVSGFSAVRILVPQKDLLALLDLFVAPGELARWPVSVPLIPLAGDEWPGLGMLWHECQIMHADQYCPAADFIAHIDPDCVFTAPVTPETCFASPPPGEEGWGESGCKPILRFENFHYISQRHPGVLRWQECTQKCLPFPVHYETMRCHPEVYHRGLYAAARAAMEQKTGQSVPDYIRTQHNEFPQTFCEFVTLGNVALQYFRPLYHLVEQTGDLVTPPNHLQQFWSHGALDQPQNIWVNGRQQNIIPLEFLKKLGLL